jgi:hypothetical protein
MSLQTRMNGTLDLIWKTKQDQRNKSQDPNIFWGWGRGGEGGEREQMGHKDNLNPWKIGIKQILKAIDMNPN